MHRSASPGVPGAVVVSALAWFTLATVAGASTIPVSGPGRVRLVYGSPTSHGNLRFRAKLPEIAVDPSCPTASSLRIVEAQGDTGELALPCARWARRNRSGVYRYFDRHGTAGGIRRITVGRGRIHVRAIAPRSLSGPAHFLEIRLTIGGTSYCGRFDHLALDAAARAVADGTLAPCKATPPRPNFLVINLDDSRADGVEAMPTLARMANEGMRFTNAFVPASVCAPSRASLLTGLNALRHGTRTLDRPLGGASVFRERGMDQRTIGVWLQAAGYRTGLFGKYVNGYRARTEGTAGPDGGFYIPPGWSRFWAVLQNEHYGGIHGLTYEVVEEDGSRTVYDDHTSDAQYLTDVSAARVREFIAGAVERDEPFFAYWAPLASHSDDLFAAAPADRHLGTVTLAPYRPPNWGLVDWLNGPRCLTTLPPDPSGGAFTDNSRVRAYESLLAVDEQLALLLDQLDSLGIREDTLVLLTSDNGVAWGQHRLVLQEKGCPYEECLRVPFVVRFPRLVAEGAVRDEPVLNVDIAPTLAGLAGMALSVPVSGADFAPLLSGSAQRWRTDFLIEYWRKDRFDRLTYRGVPSDGDRIALLYGDPRATPRPRAVFEFDVGDGVSADAIAVPIDPDPDVTFAALGARVHATVPQVTCRINTAANVLVAREPQDPEHAVYWWPELDQAGVMRPRYPRPDYLGVRDVARGYTWVEYETGERELYDLVVDPWQLTNLATAPGYASLKAELHARVQALAAP